MPQGKHSALIEVKGSIKDVEAKLQKLINKNHKLERSVQKAQKATEKQGGALDKLEGSFGKASKSLQQFQNILGGAGMVAIGAQAIQTLDAMAQKTRDFQSAQQALPFTIDKARGSTHGYIADLDLMQSALKANSFGIAETGQDFAELAELGAKLGQKIGLDSTEAIERFTEVLGKGSKDRADDLGILVSTSEAYEDYAKSIGVSVKELDKAQKEQAMQNAILAEAKKQTEAVNLELGNSTDEWLRLKAELSNLATDAAPAVLLVLSSLTEQMKPVTTAIGGMIDVVGDVSSAISEWSSYLTPNLDLNIQVGKVLKNVALLINPVTTLYQMGAIATEAWNGELSEYIGLQGDANEKTNEAVTKTDAMKASGDRLIPTLSDLTGTVGGLANQWFAYNKALASAGNNVKSGIEVQRRALEMAKAEAKKRGESAEVLAKYDQAIGHLNRGYAEFADKSKLAEERHKAELDILEAETKEREAAERKKKNAAKSARDAKKKQEEKEKKLEEARIARHNLLLAHKDEEISAVERALEKRNLEIEQKLTGFDQEAALLEAEKQSRLEVLELERQRLELANPETEAERFEIKRELRQIEHEEYMIQEQAKLDLDRLRSEEKQRLLDEETKAEEQAKKEREKLHKAQLKREKEFIETRKNIVNTVASLGRETVQLSGLIADATIKDEEKKQEAMFKVQGTMMMIKGAVEVVESIISFASQNYLEGALHLAASVTAFTTGGMLLAKQVPGGAGGGGGGGGGAAPQGNGVSLTEKRKERQGEAPELPGSPGAPRAPDQPDSKGSGSTYIINQENIVPDDKATENIVSALQKFDQQKGGDFA